MIALDILDEPLMEFGYSGTHQEQRAGLAEYGPADIEMDGRLDAVRLGIVGATDLASELQQYLRGYAKGVDAKQSDLTTLFPEFPGFTPKRGFLCKLAFPAAARRPLSRQDLATIAKAPSEVDKIRKAVDLCAAEVRALVVRRVSMSCWSSVRPECPKEFQPALRPERTSTTS